MSLEREILNRLEEKSAQIGQLQNTVHALERAADSEREHARQQHALLVEENKKLAGQIGSTQESADSADRIVKSLTQEISERNNEMKGQDRELTSYREAMQGKGRELEYVREQLKKARAERDEARAEANGLREQVPLESTREALKRAVADGNEAKAKLMKIAADCGRMDGEDVGEFIERMAKASALGVELAGCYEDLRVRNVKQEQELDELRAFAKPLEKLYVKLNDYCRENSVRENADNIYHQVAAAKSEIDRLTA